MRVRLSFGYAKVENVIMSYSTSVIGHKIVDNIGDDIGPSSNHYIGTANEPDSEPSIGCSIERSIGPYIGPSIDSTIESSIDSAIESGIGFTIGSNIDIKYP